MGAWARLTAVAAVLGTGLAVVSGAAGWDTAHRLLAALALPPLAALAATAWVSARRLLPAAVAAIVFFGLAALLTGRGVHLAFAALALCKPFVQAVQWAHLSDAQPHQFPHVGLLDANSQSRPAFDRLRQLREQHLR